jgi:hypothetical protein
MQIDRHRVGHARDRLLKRAQADRAPRTSDVGDEVDRH